MARKIVSRKITCPYCEGTQRMLNFFDPLHLQKPSGYVIDRVERSPSGREMYEHECEECYDGKLIVYGLVEFPKLILQ